MENIINNKLKKTASYKDVRRLSRVISLCDIDRIAFYIRPKRLLVFISFVSAVVCCHLVPKIGWYSTLCWFTST